MREANYLVLKLSLRAWDNVIHSSSYVELGRASLCNVANNFPERFVVIYVRILNKLKLSDH